MNKLLILTDEYSLFYASNRSPAGLSVNTLVTLFAEKGFTPQVNTLSGINREASFEGVVVLYPYSKTAGLFYKGYIEDVLLRLQNKGAVLVPAFTHFRAHQNKVFMEFMRDDFNSEALKTLRALCFGSLQGLMQRIGEILFPAVLKMSVGSHSRGVFFVENRKQLIETVKKSATIHMQDFLSKESPNISHKFIIQPFINDLRGDYSVLVFGKKYYVKYRPIPIGEHVFPQLNEETAQILDFARLAFDALHCPAVCLDIAFDGLRCHLIEFHCFPFSSNHVEKAGGYFVNTAAQWHFNPSYSAIETVYADAVTMFLTRPSSITMTLSQ
ncbi:MAG: hypothetical protein FWC16_02085 [Defluviitaleaceae bacterium]|nr:hypothetical protein [Defluviitaleaceae bacterium]MCL2273689.1 hypothetical protein [Defluviitaleaceae bacterium]